MGLKQSRKDSATEDQPAGHVSFPVCKVLQGKKNISVFGLFWQGEDLLGGRVGGGSLKTLLKSRLQLVAANSGAMRKDLDITSGQRELIVRFC